MNYSDTTPALLLMLFSTVVSVGIAGLFFILFHLRWRSRRNAVSTEKAFWDEEPLWQAAIFSRPAAWLAVKSNSLLAVQRALGLHHTQSCSFSDGLSSNHKLFITPPIKGWILVFGTGLPDPSDDVDICFRFMLSLSRKLGEIQFFSASPIVRAHAWIRAERGRILRAYAWAGKTLWKQGRRTQAERDLNVKCFDYTEASAEWSSDSDVIGANLDKVPQLAARWSLDPALIDERFLQQQRGVAGEPSVIF